MRRLLLLASLLLLGVPLTSRADIPRDPPQPRPAPEQRAPAPGPRKEESGKAACGTGAAMVLAGIALYGVWRVTKQPPAREVTS